MGYLNMFEGTPNISVRASSGGTVYIKLAYLLRGL